MFAFFQTARVPIVRARAQVLKSTLLYWTCFSSAPDPGDSQFLGAVHSTALGRGDRPDARTPLWCGLCIAIVYVHVHVHVVRLYMRMHVHHMLLVLLCANSNCAPGPRPFPSDRQGPYGFGKYYVVSSSTVVSPVGCLDQISADWDVTLIDVIDSSGPVRWGPTRNGERSHTTTRTPKQRRNTQKPPPTASTSSTTPLQGH